MKAYALFALVVAAAVLTSGMALAAGHVGVLNGQGNQSNGHGDDDNETHEQNESQSMNAAGGGGWFNVKAKSGLLAKDTFGFFLDANAGHFNNSSLVFQARDVHMTIHAIEFSNITISNKTVSGHLTANATGKAVAGGQNWTFNLVVTDMGKGNVDVFMLKLTNATMTLTWQTNGLGGGNIWVGLSDDEDHDVEDNGLIADGVSALRTMGDIIKSWL